MARDCHATMMLIFRMMEMFITQLCREMTHSHLSIKNSLLSPICYDQWSVSSWQFEGLFKGIYNDLHPERYYHTWLCFTKRRVLSKNAIKQFEAEVIKYIRRPAWVALSNLLQQLVNVFADWVDALNNQKLLSRNKIGHPMVMVQGIDCMSL